MHSMPTTHRKHLFFHTQPVRTLIEAVFLGVITSIALQALQHFLTPAHWEMPLYVIFGSLCILLFALRLRVPEVFLRQESFYDGLLAAVLCLALGGIQLVFTLILFPDWAATDLGRGK